MLANVVSTKLGTIFSFFLKGGWAGRCVTAHRGVRITQILTGRLNCVGGHMSPLLAAVVVLKGIMVRTLKISTILWSLNHQSSSDRWSPANEQRAPPLRYLCRTLRVLAAWQWLLYWSMAWRIDTDITCETLIHLSWWLGRLSEILSQTLLFKIHVMLACTNQRWKNTKHLPCGPILF